MWLLYLLVPLVVIALGILWLIAPRQRRDTTPFDSIQYAHRGLHDAQAQHPENSLVAFHAAKEAGYAVEFDIRLTKDRQIVVFHDDDLQRMCGDSRRVDACTYSELQALRLLDSNEPIPLLSDVLEVLKDTPILCEFKAMSSYTDTSLCTEALPLLNGYKGPICIESFNPLMVRWFKQNAPQYIRGILSKKFIKGEVASPLRFPLASLFTNALCRPDFIAYQHTDWHQPFFRLCRLLQPMTIAWTVRSAADEAEAARHFDTIIFEAYRPISKD